MTSYNIYKANDKNEYQAQLSRINGKINGISDGESRHKSLKPMIQKSHTVQPSYGGNE